MKKGKNMNVLGLVLGISVLIGIVMGLLVVKAPSTWWVLASIIILAIIVGLLIVFAKNNKYKKPDYKAMYILGICILPLGIIFDHLRVFLILGLIYIAIGLKHKKEWKK